VSCHSGKVALDKNHPYMAPSYTNIGLALGSKGDGDTALVEYGKCLAIWEVTLGRDHPNTISTSENMGQGPSKPQLLHLKTSGE
jgi:hypothetical protein